MKRNFFFAAVLVLAAFSGSVFAQGVVVEVRNQSCMSGKQFVPRLKHDDLRIFAEGISQKDDNHGAAVFLVTQKEGNSPYWSFATGAVFEADDGSKNPVVCKQAAGEEWELVSGGAEGAVELGADGAVQKKVRLRMPVKAVVRGLEVAYQETVRAHLKYVRNGQAHTVYLLASNSGSWSALDVDDVNQIADLVEYGDKFVFK